jgi:hypothetical protein
MLTIWFVFATWMYHWTELRAVQSLPSGEQAGSGCRLLGTT